MTAMLQSASTSAALNAPAIDAFIRVSKNPTTALTTIITPSARLITARNKVRGDNGNDDNQRSAALLT